MGRGVRAVVGEGRRGFGLGLGLGLGFGLRLRLGLGLVVPPPEPLDTHWDDSWDQGMVEPTQAPFQPAPAEGFYANSGPELAGLAYAAFVEALAPFGLLERRRHFVTEDEATALRIGQTLGDVVGLVGDVAAIVGGVAVGVGGGGLGVVGSAPTAGAALAVSVASAAAGSAMINGGLTDAAIRIVRMTRGGGGEGDAPAAGPRIHMGQQGKHIPGHNNFRPGRSVLHANPEELARRAGTGQQVGRIPVGQPGSRERVVYDEVIGLNVEGGSGGVGVPTRVGIIHYSSHGIHIVPGRPQ